MANLTTLRTWNYIWDRLANFISGGNAVGTESPFGGDPVVIDTAMTLYVDPATGSDSAPGGPDRPFATVQGAANYLKGFDIGAPVTISVAAGTYTGDTVISDLHFVGRSASLTITGPTTWTAATLGSGSATGSVTSYAAPVSGSATVGTLTDSTQTWTVNALKGLFVKMTSGALTGVRKVIMSNTATGVDIGVTLGAVTGGMTYAIERPAVILTGRFDVSNNSGMLVSGAITVQNIDIQSASGTSPTTSLVAIQSCPADGLAVHFTDARVLLVHDNIFISRVYASTVRFTNCYLSYSGTGLGFGILADSAAEVALRGSYVRVNSSGGGGDALRNTGAYLTTFLQAITVVEVAGSSSNPAIWSVPDNQVTNTRFAGGIVIRSTASRGAVEIATSGSSFLPAYLFAEGGLRIETASVGLTATGTSAIRLNQASISPTFVSVTTELKIDNTLSTYAAFTALTPKKIVGDFGTTLVQY